MKITRKNLREMISRVISEGEVGSWVDSGISAYRLGGGRETADIRHAQYPPPRFAVGDLVIPGSTYWEGIEGKVVNAEWDFDFEEWIMTVAFGSTQHSRRTFLEDDLEPAIRLGE